ncbi:hypothetical protein BC941DRAFT_455508 [Chlamydoabsidia padenii]|nr:hypothetical protein BC941DRAFT_455508 [Chlamydoabsidia padenii]
MTSSQDFNNKDLPNPFYYFDETPMDILIGDGTGGRKRRTLPATFDETLPRSYKRPLLSTPELVTDTQQSDSPLVDPEHTNSDSPCKPCHQTGLNFQPERIDSSVPTSTTFKTIPINGVRIKFPFQPYQAQIQMMSKIIEALHKKQHAVLESPTGNNPTHKK